jgi:hypothetical protein
MYGNKLSEKAGVKFINGTRPGVRLGRLQWKAPTEADMRARYNSKCFAIALKLCCESLSELTSVKSVNAPKSPADAPSFCGVHSFGTD